MNTDKRNELISVIVPVHNGEKTIKRCIDSVLRQNYKNIEIIIVDDNSTDSTYDIIKNLVEKNDNIICIKLTEGSKGVSYARNTGLKVAKGKYVGFVDADDFVSENMYCTMVSKLNARNADIVICAYSFVYEDHRILNPTNHLKPDYEVVLSPEDAILELMKVQGARFTGHVWDKLYKKSIIGNIEFVEGVHCFEDTLFNVDVMARAKRIDFFNTPLYSYYINSASVTNSCYNDKIYSSIQALVMMENSEFIKRNAELTAAVQSRILKECVIQSYMSVKSPEWQKYIMKFRKLVLDRIKFASVLNLTLKEKVQIVLLVCFTPIYKGIILRKNK